MATATKNFRDVNLIGEGGFGKVYKGRLESGEARVLLSLLFDEECLDYSISHKKNALPMLKLVELFHHCWEINQFS